MGQEQGGLGSPAGMPRLYTSTVTMGEEAKVLVGAERAAAQISMKRPIQPAAPVAAAVISPAAPAKTENRRGTTPPRRSGTGSGVVPSESESDEDDAAETAAIRLATLNKAPAAAALAAMEAERQAEYSVQSEDYRFEDCNRQVQTTSDDCKSSGKRHHREQRAGSGRVQGGAEMPEAAARHCDACNACPKRTTVCCRQCWGEYHPGCAGFNPAGRLYPPPQWHCPHCEGGTRGPGKTHAYFMGKGIEVHGDQPWCPICFQDNRREVTKAEAKGGRKWRACPGAEHCPGCNLITHPACLAKLPRNRAGMWACPECKLRRENRHRRRVGGNHVDVSTDGRVRRAAVTSSISTCSSIRNSMSPEERATTKPYRGDAAVGPLRSASIRTPPPPSFKKRLAAKAKAGVNSDSSDPRRDTMSHGDRERKRIEGTFGCQMVEPKRKHGRPTLQEAAAYRAYMENLQIMSSTPHGTTGKTMGNRLPARLPNRSTTEPPPKRGRGRPRRDSVPLDDPSTERNGQNGGSIRGRPTCRDVDSSSPRLYSRRNSTAPSVLQQAGGTERPARVAAARKDLKVAELLAAAQAITGSGGGGQVGRRDGNAAYGNATLFGQRAESAEWMQDRTVSTRAEGRNYHGALRKGIRSSAARQPAVGGARMLGSVAVSGTGDITCEKCKKVGKRKLSKTCSSCNLSWHAVCAAGSWCTGTGEWVGGWRCRNCLNHWEREVKERTASVVKAWAEHHAERERNAEGYRASAAEAIAEAKESENHGFLVGDVEVEYVRISFDDELSVGMLMVDSFVEVRTINLTGILPFLDVDSIRDTGFRLARFTRDDCCFMGPEGIAAKVDLCWKHRIFAVIEGAFDEQKQPLMEFLGCRKAVPCKISGKASTGEASSTMGDYMQKLGVADKAEKPTKDNPGTFFLDTAQGQAEGLQWLSKDPFMKDLMPESARGGLEDHLLGDRCKFGPFTFGGGRNYPLIERDAAADRVGRVSRRQFMQGMDRKRIGGSTTHMDGMGSFTAIGGIKAGVKSVTAFETQDCALALAVAKFKSFAKPGGSSYVVNNRIDDDTTLRGRFAQAGVRFFTFPIRQGDAYLVPSGALHEFMNVVPCLSVAWNIMPHPANCKVAMAMAEKSAEEAETVLGVDTDRSQSAIEHAPPECMRERNAAYTIKRVLAHRMLLKRRRRRQPSIATQISYGNEVARSAAPPRDDKIAAEDATALLDMLSPSIRKSVLFARPPADHYMYAGNANPRARSVAGTGSRPVLAAVTFTRSVVAPKGLRVPDSMGMSTPLRLQDRQPLARVPEMPAHPSFTPSGIGPFSGSLALLPPPPPMPEGYLNPADGGAVAGSDADLTPLPSFGDMLGRFPNGLRGQCYQPTVGQRLGGAKGPSREDASGQSLSKCDRVIARPGTLCIGGREAEDHDDRGCQGERGYRDQSFDRGVASRGTTLGESDVPPEVSKEFVRQVIRRASNVAPEVTARKADAIISAANQGEKDQGLGFDACRSGGNAYTADSTVKNACDKGEDMARETASNRGKGHSSKDGRSEKAVNSPALATKPKRRRRVEADSSDDNDDAMSLIRSTREKSSGGLNQGKENTTSSRRDMADCAQKETKMEIKHEGEEVKKNTRDEGGGNSGDSTPRRHKPRLATFSAFNREVDAAVDSKVADPAHSRSSEQDSGLRDTREGPAVGIRPTAAKMKGESLLPEQRAGPGTVGMKGDGNESAQNVKEPAMAAKKSDYRIPKKSYAGSASPRSFPVGMEMRIDGLGLRAVGADKGRQREGHMASVSKGDIWGNRSHELGNRSGVRSDRRCFDGSGSLSPRGIRGFAWGRSEGSFNEQGKVTRISEEIRGDDSGGKRQREWIERRERLNRPRSDSLSSCGSRVSSSNGRSMDERRRGDDRQRRASREWGAKCREDCRERSSSSSSTRTAKRNVEGSRSDKTRRYEGGRYDRSVRLWCEGGGNGRRARDSRNWSSCPGSTDRSWSRGDTSDGKLRNTKTREYLSSSQSQERSDSYDSWKSTEPGRFGGGDGRQDIYREGRAGRRERDRGGRHRSNTYVREGADCGAGRSGSDNSYDSRRKTEHTAGGRRSRFDRPSRSSSGSRGDERTESWARRDSRDCSSSSSSTRSREGTDKGASEDCSFSLEYRESARDRRETQRTRSGEKQASFGHFGNHDDRRRNIGAGGGESEYSKTKWKLADLHELHGGGRSEVVQREAEETDRLGRRHPRSCDEDDDGEKVVATDKYPRVWSSCGGEHRTLYANEGGHHSNRDQHAGARGLGSQSADGDRTIVGAGSDGYHAMQPMRTTLAWNPRPSQDDPPRRRTEGGAMHNVRGQRGRDSVQGLKEFARASSRRNPGTLKSECSRSSENRTADVRGRATGADEEGLLRADYAKSSRDSKKAGKRGSEDARRPDQKYAARDHRNSNDDESRTESVGSKRLRNSKPGEGVPPNDRTDRLRWANVETSDERSETINKLRYRSGAPAPKKRLLDTEPRREGSRHNRRASDVTGESVVDTENGGGGERRNSAGGTGGNAGSESSPRVPLPKKKRPLVETERRHKHRKHEARNKQAMCEVSDRTAEEGIARSSVLSSNPATDMGDAQASAAVSAAASVREAEGNWRGSFSHDGRDDVEFGLHGDQEWTRDDKSGQDRTLHGYAHRRARGDIMNIPAHARSREASTADSAQCTTNIRQGQNLGRLSQSDDDTHTSAPSDDEKFGVGMDFGSNTISAVSVPAGSRGRRSSASAAGVSRGATCETVLPNRTWDAFFRQERPGPVAPARSGLSTSRDAVDYSGWISSRNALSGMATLASAAKKIGETE